MPEAAASPAPAGAANRAKAAPSPAKVAAASPAKAVTSPAKASGGKAAAIMMGPPPEQPAAGGGDKAPAGKRCLSAAKLYRDGCWTVKEQPQTMAYAEKVADAGWAEVYVTQGRDGTKTFSYLADVQLSVKRDFVLGCGALFRRATGSKSTTVEALVSTDVPNIVLAPGVAHLHVHEASSKVRLHCGPHCTVAMPATLAAAAIVDCRAQEPVVAPAAGAMFIVAAVPERTTVLIRSAMPTFQRDSAGSVFDYTTNIYVLGHTQVHPTVNCELFRHETAVDAVAGGKSGSKGGKRKRKTDK